MDALPRLAAPVIVLTGAGVSTASGIPDFRSPGGLWDRFDPMEFHVCRFHADPARFWSRRAAYITAARHLDAPPNAAHTSLAQATRDGRVARVVTQNVDGLHAKAGTPAERLIELHGNGSRAACLSCAARVPMQDVLARVGTGAGPAPRCACGGLLKPDVVLFGEEVLRMPEAVAAVAGAASLVVAGTSLQVHPAAGLVGIAAAAGARVVLCNREPTPYDAQAAAVLRGPVEDVLPRLLDSLQPSVQ